MEYRIVEGAQVMQKFIDEVNKLMKEGWRPQGGIAVIDNENAWYYYQAMIKE